MMLSASRVLAPFFGFRYAALLATLLAAASSASGEVRRVELPSTYADFCINPDTGDVAAVDHEAGKATLFRQNYFTGDKSAMVGPARVGSVPSSVAFKRYQDQTYFAVVCTQDAHLYLFDAITFAPVKKIPVVSTDVTLVHCSRNPEDPFVYYFFGRGQGANAGAIDVRSMTDCGMVFDDAMDGAISASGTVAYRRGPFSPTGFEAIQLTNQLTDKKPVFEHLHSDHKNSEAYVPDPFDRYTAVGTVWYTRDLKQGLKSVGLPIGCFFLERPVAIGVRKYIDARSGRTRGQLIEKQMIQLEAVSYNTLKRVDTEVPMPESFAREAPLLPRGSAGARDKKEPRLNRRLMADDKRDQVICGYLDEIFLVPLADFKLPDEVFMQVQLTGPNTLSVGTKSTIQIKKSDPRIEVDFPNMPDGMQKVDGGIEWTPRADQVGAIDLLMNVRYADLEQEQSARLTVAYPGVELPFNVLSFAINDDATMAICWDAPPRDRYGRPSTTPREESHVAVVDLVNPKIVSQKKLPFAVGTPVIDQHYAYLPSKQQNYVYVCKLDTLERVKMLYTSAPASYIKSLAGESVVIYDKKLPQRYSLPALERSTTPPDLPISTPSRIPGGLMIDGVVYDRTGKTRKMIFGTDGIYRLPIEGIHFSMPPSRSPLNTGASSARRPMGMGSGPWTGNRTVAGPTDLVDHPIRLTVDINSERVGDPQRSFQFEVEPTLVLSDLPTGTARKRIKLARLPLAFKSNSPLPITKMQVRDDTVVLLSFNRLFRWTPEGVDLSEYPLPLSFKFEQSAFVIQPQKTTLLKHKLEGGRGPFEFTLLNPCEGLKIDEKTGIITIDAAPVLAGAEATLVEVFARQLRYGDGSAAQVLLNYMRKNMDAATRLIGRKPTGIPVGVPLQLRASDSQSQKTRLQYYVMAEVPHQGLAKKIDDRAAELEAEREAKRQASRPPETVKPTPGPTSPRRSTDEDKVLRGEVNDLLEKVESLDEKLDVLTREIMRLSKEQEE